MSQRPQNNTSTTFKYLRPGPGKALAPLWAWSRPRLLSALAALLRAPAADWSEAWAAASQSPFFLLLLDRTSHPVYEILAIADAAGDGDGDDDADDDDADDNGDDGDDGLDAVAVSFSPQAHAHIDTLMFLMMPSLAPFRDMHPPPPI